MLVTSAISSRIYYTRKRIWRRIRIWFPSPAELQFVRVMGGRAIVIDHIKYKRTGFSLAIITSMGKILRREYVQRELRVGPYYADFAFVTRDSKKIIEIDGKYWHRDIVKEQERDDYLMSRGWRVMHITATEVYANPDPVQRRVIEFLAK